MRHLKNPQTRNLQSDLFESPQPVTAIQIQDRVMLLDLLQVLVTEAFTMPLGDRERAAKEAGDE
jgi:hypothetical protein